MRPDILACCNGRFLDFNPRTHRGVRRVSEIKGSGLGDFNPRTHRGVRHDQLKQEIINLIFQSTHPSWGATSIIHPTIVRMVISIHAPIVGCDINIIFSGSCDHYFNPRTHRGVRQRKITSQKVE